MLNIAKRGQTIRIHLTTESTQSQFVGRTHELKLLLRSLPLEPRSGGRMVVLAGEAGMGKTRLLSELADIAGGRGVKVLWSQLSEDPAVPPYFSWRLALRSYVQQTTKSELAADAGSAAPMIATIVPELADFLDVRPRHDNSDSPAARLQLFDSITRFLLRAAARQPLLLMFDNLQAADRSSLALLENFSHQLAGNPVAVVGTLRDSDLARKHPLRESLTKMSRSAGFTRIALEGLSKAEVAELLQLHIGYRPPASFVEAVQHRSDGNPLFVAEVAAMLLKRNPDELLTRNGFHFKVPGSLSNVIADRLDELPTRTTDILRVASVLGRSFDLIALAGLANRSVEPVRRDLEAAESSGIVGSVIRDKYSFAHALFREVLYAENNNIVRLALHKKAGEQIEKRHEEDLDAHVAELAYHFFEAAQSGEENKAMKYCMRAADHACKQRAYSEAVASLESALQVVDVLVENNNELRYDLLKKIGLAQYQAGELNRSTDSLLKAFVLAYRNRWWNKLADALFLFQLVCQQSGYRHISSVPMHKEVLENLSGDDKSMRAKMLVSLSRAYRSIGDPELAASTFEKGVVLARAVGDKNLLLTCLRKGAWSAGRLPSRIKDGLDISREAFSLATDLQKPEFQLDALVDTIFQLCDIGAIDEVEEGLLELRRIVAREQQTHFDNLVIGFETSVSVLRGDWKRATASAREGLRHLPLQGVYGLRGRFGFQMFAIQRAQGLLEGVQDVAERIISSGNSEQHWLPGQILLHCELGQLPQARRAIRTLGDLRRLPRDDLFLVSLIFLADAAVAMRDTERCRIIYELLRPYSELNATLPGALMFGAVSGYLGSLALATGNLAEARRWLDKALIFNKAMHARPALARTKVDLARLLLANETESDRERSCRLLEEARGAATDLNLRSILRLADELDDGVDAGNLTDREIDVLRNIAAGLSNRHISDKLSISTSTVATHIRHIFRKIGVKNRTSAAEFARRRGLLD
jgi:DNA-binding CsgD family transcriptional regulator